MVVTDFKETKLPSFENHPPLTTRLIYSIHYECMVVRMHGHLGIRYFCGQCASLEFLLLSFFFFFFFFSYYNFLRSMFAG